MIHNNQYINYKKKRTGWASLCCTVEGGVHFVYRVGHYNGFVKFESSGRYHCIRITILNGDDLLDIYGKNIIIIIESSSSFYLVVISI
jgi:hypothetical protein